MDGELEDAAFEVGLPSLRKAGKVRDLLRGERGKE
jgi:hypothetical protein